MAAAVKTTELDDLVSRLRSAAWALEDAASGASAAVQDITDATPSPVADEDAVTAADLALLVRTLHEAEHTGPMRWCVREACRRTDEVMPR